jgi:hypothetical protein
MDLIKVLALAGDNDILTLVAQLVDVAKIKADFTRYLNIVLERIVREKTAYDAKYPEAEPVPTV